MRACLPSEVATEGPGRVNFRYASTEACNSQGYLATWHRKCAFLLSLAWWGVVSIRGIDLFLRRRRQHWGARQAGVEDGRRRRLWDIATRPTRTIFRPSAATSHGASGRRLGIAHLQNIGRVDLIIGLAGLNHHSIARGANPSTPRGRRSGWYLLRFIEEDGA